MARDAGREPASVEQARLTLGPPLTA
jgi:hypothetical protein